MQTSEHESKNWLEWTVFAIGCLLVLGVMGSLGYEIWKGRTANPAVLSVTLGEPEPRGDYFAIPVTVSNSGDETAENVQVQVVLELSEGRKERSQFQLHFVPQHAERQGYAIFETDPANAVRITARPLGYHKP